MLLVMTLQHLKNIAESFCKSQCQLQPPDFNPQLTKNSSRNVTSLLHPQKLSTGPNLTTVHSCSHCHNFIPKPILILYYYLLLKEAEIAQWYSAGLRAGWLGVRVPVGAGNFLFTTASRLAQGPTKPPIQWVPGALSLRLKRPGCEDNHPPPSIAEVKKM
jgi:hypothetical protein